MYYNQYMSETDAKRPKQKVLMKLREQSIRLRQNGWTYVAIAEAIGVSYCAVSNWCRAYSNGGDKAIRLQKRGRSEGMKRTLTFEQEREIRKSIRDKRPEQLKMPFALWTRKAVKQLIKLLFDIDIYAATINGYIDPKR